MVTVIKASDLMNEADKAQMLALKAEYTALTTSAKRKCGETV
jgi:hypothetical protein